MAKKKEIIEKVKKVEKVEVKPLPPKQKDPSFDVSYPDELHGVVNLKIGDESYLVTESMAKQFKKQLLAKGY